MKRFLPIIAGIAVVIFAAAIFVHQPDAYAQVSGVENGANAARGADQPGNLFGGTGIFTKITNIMLFIIGALSVIMLIIGGLRYVVSGGNSSAVTAAKNTILYAIVGIVVALLAYAIINFVLGTFTGAVSGGGTNI